VRDAASSCSLAGKGRARAYPWQCVIVGVERSSCCAKGSSALTTSQGLGAWMTSRGSDETEKGRTKWRSVGGLRRLSFGFGFEQSKAWTGYDGPWAVILPWWVVFMVKIGYLVLLVPDIRNHNNGSVIPPNWHRCILYRPQHLID
jgi:hypothetical protein